MNSSSFLKIDSYSHIIPPKYKEAIRKIAPEPGRVNFYLLRAATGCRSADIQIANGRAFTARPLQTFPTTQSVRPAALAVWAEVIAGRARAVHRHRMAASTWTAPPSGPAPFSNLNDDAVGVCDGSWSNSGVRRRRKTQRQCGAQHN